MNKIPGLVSITEGENGSFVFEIEDEKVEEFFNAFGLKSGDVDGFQVVLNEAIQLLIDSYSCDKEKK
jgi:hypothetical protein